MKHYFMSHKKRKLRPLLLFIPFTTLIILLALIIPVFATEIPFSGENVITNTFGEANSVFAADIDGNGTLDVLGAATTGDAVAWWSNVNGDATTWTEGIIDASFDGAEEVHAADVDGDGDLDVLGAARFGGEFAWWENANSDGTTWVKNVVSPRPQAMSIRGEDIDLDGDIDVVGATYEEDEIYWWENGTGDGSTWITHTVSLNTSGARHVRVADIDSDGDPDLLSVALLSDNDISWWENSSGDGTTWIEHRLNDFFLQARTVNAADIDGDGDLDIVGGAQAANWIAWWENVDGDGSAWIERTVTASFFGVRSVYPVDFDLDGDIDLIGAAFTANAVRWWENSIGDGTAWTEHQIDNTFGNAISAYAADLDQDGDPDFLGAAQLENSISWWENETIHSISLYPQLFEHTIATGLDGSVFSPVADIDQDGDPDVLATVYNEGVISWWENGDGIGQTWTENIIDTSLTQPYMIRPADIDQDGDLDVAAVATAGSELSWWENANAGTSWTKWTVDTPGGPLAIEITDIDRDGDLDLISVDDNGPTAITWWENQLNGTAWQAHIIGTILIPNQGVRSIDSADIDGDGDMDVLTGSNLGTSLDWWENLDGVGLIWLRHNMADNDFDSPYYMDSIDMDRDGDIDVFAGARVSNEFAWWENNGGGLSWIKHTVDTLDGADNIQAIDLDYDGDLDILGSALDDNEYSWWENAGDSMSWTKHLLNISENATSIAATDMDGDGDLDLVGAAFEADNILWWENRGGQFGLATSDSSPMGLGAGGQDDLLTVVVTHNGRAGDHDLEMVTFELRLEETAGDPLSNAEANAIIDNLEIYRDEGSGIFEPGLDTLVTVTDTLTLDNTGLLTITFADGDPNVQVAFGTPQPFFVVVNIATDVETNPARNGVNAFIITHETESSSTAEDRDFDIPLRLAYSPNASATLTLLDPTAVTLTSVNVQPTSGLWPAGVVLMLALLVSLFVWRKRKVAVTSAAFQYADRG